MLKRLLLSLPFVALGVLASTNSAFAAFDPTHDELSIGTFLVAVGAMVVLATIYAIVSLLGINKPEPVEIPDHAHDFRYAGHH
jgi:hypothetical protein